MPVKNAKDKIECDKAYYSKLDHMTVIMCSREPMVVCSHAKLCDECGHFVLKRDAITCVGNGSGSNPPPLREDSGCGCKK